MVRMLSDWKHLAQRGPLLVTTAFRADVFMAGRFRGSAVVFPNTVDRRPLVGLIRLSIELGGNGDIRVAKKIPDRLKVGIVVDQPPGEGVAKDMQTFLVNPCPLKNSPHYLLYKPANRLYPDFGNRGTTIKWGIYCARNRHSDPNALCGIG